MPEGDRRGFDPLCWEWGRLGQVAAARSCLAAFGLLFGEVCAPAAWLRGAWQLCQHS